MFFSVNSLEQIADNEGARVVQWHWGDALCAQW